MGEPIKIADLAHKMIRLRGLRVNADIPVVVTGLRPGEKLHEKLVGSWERETATAHPRISRLESDTHVQRDVLVAQVSSLLASLRAGSPPGSLKHQLFDLVQVPETGEELPEAGAHHRTTAPTQR